ncbi:MAG TPA: hypothetical protein VFF39_19720 [Verrucomicrobiae bacterium]|nr:hypothetical protein [Verrucomicrobiae bacterium]
MAASERILELQRDIVDELVRKSKEAETPSDRAMLRFLGTITKIDYSDVGHAEYLLKDPHTLIAAIIAYLEERDG